MPTFPRPLRSVARTLLPDPLRTRLGWEAILLWRRVADAVLDAYDAAGGRTATPPVPPRRLRRRVGITGLRHEFHVAGEQAAREIARAFLGASRHSADGPRWLDFGCGCGRIARHLRRFAPVRKLTGVDVDAAAIQWAGRWLVPDRYVVIEPAPPLPFPDRSFDAIYAASVFTHLAEEPQLAWLDELGRLLAPAGLLLASTHSEGLSHLRPDLAPDQARSLAHRGFAFVPSARSFNDATAFHARRYLEATWGRRFDLLSFEPCVLFSFQDLSVWRARV